MQNEKASEQKPSAKISRRGFFDRMLMTVVGGAAVVVAGVQPAAAKVSKMAAKYRSNSGMYGKCANCSRYRGGGKCSKVSGAVSSQGWCRYYAHKVMRKMRRKSSMMKY